jgi:hypothetical protein
MVQDRTWRRGLRAYVPCMATTPEEWGEARQRTVTWYDPLLTAQRA